MKPYILLAFVIFSASSCVKNIDLTSQPYDPQITIESLLEPGELLKVYVHNSISFFDPAFFSEDAFLRDAKVEINGQALHLDSTYSDFWCRHNYFFTTDEFVEENTTYDLKVSYNGANYNASTTTNVRQVEFDSITYVPQYADRYADVSQGIAIHFQDPTGADQYRFFMSREVDENVMIEDDFEYKSKCLNGGTTIVNDVGRFIEFDSDYGDGSYITLIMEPSHSFVVGDELTVQLQTLDPKTADYLDHLEDLKYFSLNPFVEPVFPDNQIEGAFGFFGSSRKSSTIMTIVLPEDSN